MKTRSALVGATSATLLILLLGSNVAIAAANQSITLSYFGIMTDIGSQSYRSSGGSLVSASVTAAGKTGASRGVDSAAHESTGIYRVAFTGDVTNCAYSATVVEDGTQQGFATVQPVDAQTLRVRVRQASADNPLADRGFHLTVIC